MPTNFKTPVIYDNNQHREAEANVDYINPAAIPISEDAGNAIETRGNGLYSAGGGGSTGSASFVGLTDTPANYTGSGGLVVKVNTTETGLIFAPESGGSDVSNFTDLGDTFTNYVGRGGQALIVNSTEDGITTTTVQPGGVEEFIELTDGPRTYGKKESLNFIQPPYVVASDTTSIINSEYATWVKTATEAIVTGSGTSRTITLRNDYSGSTVSNGRWALYHTIPADPGYTSLALAFSGTENSREIRVTDLLINNKSANRLQLITPAGTNYQVTWVGNQLGLIEANADILLRITITALSAAQSGTGVAKYMAAIECLWPNINEASGEEGVTEFLALEDVDETTYASNEGKAIAVNEAGTGLEFIDFPRESDNKAIIVRSSSTDANTGIGVKQNLLVIPETIPNTPFVNTPNTFWELDTTQDLSYSFQRVTAPDGRQAKRESYSKVTLNTGAAFYDVTITSGDYSVEEAIVCNARDNNLLSFGSQTGTVLKNRYEGYGLALSGTLLFDDTVSSIGPDFSTNGCTIGISAQNSNGTTAIDVQYTTDGEVTIISDTADYSNRCNLRVIACEFDTETNTFEIYLYLTWLDYDGGVIWNDWIYQINYAKLYISCSFASASDTVRTVIPPNTTTAVCDVLSGITEVTLTDESSNSIVVGSTPVDISSFAGMPINISAEAEGDTLVKVTLSTVDI